MQGNIKIAGHVFSIRVQYEQVLAQCREYATDEPAEYEISVLPEEIEKEKAGTIKECEKEGIPYKEAPLYIYESMAIYGKITAALHAHDTLLFHGSTIAVDGCAYMFLAKSGTGKSTHTRLWREWLGTDAVMVNDDKPLVKITDRGVWAYGTPWNGKHKLGNNITVPLKGMCILRRGEENSIRQIGLPEAYSMLLQQVYRLPGSANLQKTMALIDKMENQVRFYTMNCTVSTEAAKMAYRVMHKGEDYV